MASLDPPRDTRPPSARFEVSTQYARVLRAHRRRTMRNMFLMSHRTKSVRSRRGAMVRVARTSPACRVTARPRTVNANRRPRRRVFREGHARGSLPWNTAWHAARHPHTLFLLPPYLVPPVVQLLVVSRVLVGSVTVAGRLRRGRGRGEGRCGGDAVFNSRRPG